MPISGLVQNFAVLVFLSFQFEVKGNTVTKPAHLPPQKAVRPGRPVVSVAVPKITGLIKTHELPEV